MTKRTAALEQKVLEHLAKTDTYLDLLESAFERNGIPAAHLNAQQLCQKSAALVSEALQCEQTVKEMGYNTLGTALKALGQTRKVVAVLPGEIKYAPTHWVISDYYRTEEVWKNANRTQRKILVRGRTARTAQRLRDGLEGMLQELWYRTETDSNMNEEEKESYKREVIGNYHDPEVTYERFAEMILEGLHGTDCPTNEEFISTECTETTDPELAAKLEEYRRDCEAAGVTYNEGTARVFLVHHAR